MPFIKDIYLKIWFGLSSKIGSACFSFTLMIFGIWPIWVFKLMLSAYRCLSSTGLTGTAFAKTARMLAAIFENFILSFSFKFVLISQFDFCGNFDHSKEFIFWLYINNWNDSCHLEVLLKLKSNVLVLNGLISGLVDSTWVVGNLQ